MSLDVSYGSSELNATHGFKASCDFTTYDMNMHMENAVFTEGFIDLFRGCNKYPRENDAVILALGKKSAF